MYRFTDREKIRHFNEIMRLWEQSTDRNVLNYIDFIRGNNQ